MTFVYYSCFIKQKLNMKIRKKFLKFIRDSIPFLTPYARKNVLNKIHQIIMPVYFEKE